MIPAGDGIEAAEDTMDIVLSSIVSKRLLTVLIPVKELRRVVFALVFALFACVAFIAIL